MTENNTLTTQAPEYLPPVPAAVSAFAASQGAADNVQTVLRMTRRHFPTAPLSLRVWEDADSDDSYIAVEVDTRDYDERRRELGPVEWADELFRECPSRQMCQFRLTLA